MTDSERMRLCKWAKKNGATQIKIDGVEITFGIPELERLGHEVPSFPPSNFYNPPKAPVRPVETPAEATSTKKALEALRSHMDDPDVYSQASDEWANQSRLPRR